MYIDDPDIRIVVVQSDDDLHPWEQTVEHLSKKGYDVIGCGQFSLKPHRAIYDFPNSFYDDMDIPRIVRKSHFRVPITVASNTLYESFSGRPYIIVHQEASTHTLPIIRRLRVAGETRLIINLSKKPTEQDGVISIYKPFIDYARLMEEAEEIHLIDSSIFCFAMFLNLERVNKRVYYVRPGGALTDSFNVFEAVTDYI